MTQDNPGLHRFGELAGAANMLHQAGRPRHAVQQHAHGRRLVLGDLDEERNDQDRRMVGKGSAGPQTR